MLLYSRSLVSEIIFIFIFMFPKHSFIVLNNILTDDTIHAQGHQTLSAIAKQTYKHDLSVRCLQE